MSRLFVLIFSLFYFFNVFSQDTVSVKTPNFVKPLLDKIVSEYNDNNDRKIVIEYLKPNLVSRLTTIEIKLDEKENDLTFGQYIVVPFTTKNSVLFRKNKKLSKKQITELFFIDSSLDFEEKRKHAFDELNVYTSLSKQSGSKVYAKVLDKEDNEYRGKRISGDDKFINDALLKDNNGVGITSLSNIFDSEKKSLIEDYRLIQVESNKEIVNAILDSDFETVFKILETKEIELLPTRNIGIDYDSNNSVSKNFVNFFLAHAKNYLHDYGMIQKHHD